LAQSEDSRSWGPWQPLRNSTFRNLLASNLISDIGTFMQSVGAAWLMTSLTRNPLYIALIQTASALPFFLLALPAGSIGDIFDRRKLILGTETWMLVIAIVLTVATFAGVMTPWLLLLLTLGLSVGDAVESPTWRAIFPELVAKEELPAALALNARDEPSASWDAEGRSRGFAPREHPDNWGCLHAGDRRECFAGAEFSNIRDSFRLEADACLRRSTNQRRIGSAKEKKLKSRERFDPKWTKLDFEGWSKCLNLMVDAVGIEPTTCRLRADD